MLWIVQSWNEEKQEIEKRQNNTTTQQRTNSRFCNPGFRPAIQQGFYCFLNKNVSQLSQVLPRSRFRGGAQRRERGRGRAPPISLDQTEGSAKTFFESTPFSSQDLDKSATHLKSRFGSAKMASQEGIMVHYNTYQKLFSLFYSQWLLLESPERDFLPQEAAVIFTPFMGHPVLIIVVTT